jgi:hypothetical protein
MAKLENLSRGTSVKGILPDQLVTVVDVKWIGNVAIDLTYKDAAGRPANELLYRDRESTIEIVAEGSPWSFDGDGALFRLVSEAQRIRLAYLFDPLLAVHTSMVEPLPHQITAVYGEMLPRQPLRYLLADDPGSGKTIMTGLLVKEEIVRGDLQRCMIVCPGNLAEQWQDELDRRFHLPFDIMTNDKLESARTGNWFQENSLVICRLDKLSRDEALHPKLEQCDWDLIVCDEAHKMSASFFSGEVKPTKRYKLGQLLSTRTRNFLLLTATPHNGKEEDFQLFLALLDGDRFEGKFRDGTHTVDTSDLMRRLVKEQLLKFDGRPLFPERRACTVNYDLSDAETQLYERVTAYVREEFNRAEALESEGRKGTVGFALTVLQRRLASSPEAIYQSLCRRKERLEKRVREEQILRRGAEVRVDEQALDRDHLRKLIEERALTADTMDASKVRSIREDMERAEARRLQRHFIATFFSEAFKRLGGKVHDREPKRFEITNVPAIIRNRDRAIGHGSPVMIRHERITFEKDLIAVPGKALADFVCPGHPLLDSTIDLTLERNRDLLRRGAVLVDETDPGEEPRVLVFLEHSIQDARPAAGGQRRIVSKQMQFVEIDAGGDTRAAGYAPYLDYHPLTEEELPLLPQIPEPAWLRSELEAKVLQYAIEHLVPSHFDEVRCRKEELVDKTTAAVKDRLTQEIRYWDHRAIELKEQELAGKVLAELNSGLARQRADELAARLRRRMSELEQERKLSPLPPVVAGAALIVPAGLLGRLRPGQAGEPSTYATDTKESELRAVAAVMDAERRLGFLPKDVSDEKCGYDLESSIRGTGRLRFIEVKGRVAGAKTVTVTKNEILTALNKPEEFILAIVEHEGDASKVHYVRRPFQREPDFGVTSCNYAIEELLQQATDPC